MKKLTSLVAVALATVLAVALPLRETSAQRKPESSPAAEKLARAKAISFDFLAGRIGRYGISDTSELKTKRLFVDDEAGTHTHVQQTHRGVPVFGGEAIVHLNGDDSVSAFTDDLVEFVQVDTQPDIPADQATERAVRAYGCGECLTAAPAVDLWVLRHNGADYLTHRVQLRREDGTEETAMPVYFIDAHTGNVIWSYDNLQTATGVSLYSGSVTINTY